METWKIVFLQKTEEQTWEEAINQEFESWKDEEWKVKDEEIIDYNDEYLSSLMSKEEIQRSSRPVLMCEETDKYGHVLHRFCYDIKL